MMLSLFIRLIAFCVFDPVIILHLYIKFYIGICFSVAHACKKRGDFHMIGQRQLVDLIERHDRIGNARLGDAVHDTSEHCSDSLPLFTQADDGISDFVDLLLVVTGTEQFCLPRFYLPVNLGNLSL